MTTGRVTRIRVEIEVGSPAERVLADWLRSWRRRGVRQDGKPSYPDQGTSKAMVFQAPMEAAADLGLRLANVPSSSIRRASDVDPGH